jgi:cell division septal protein FtsQ
LLSLFRFAVSTFPDMNPYEYRLIAAGGALLILFLGVFWYAILSRLSVVLKEHLAATRSHQSLTDLRSVLLFLFRGDFKQSADERLVGVCRRLRQRLAAYLAFIAVYVLFLVIFRPRF